MQFFAEKMECFNKSAVLLFYKITNIKKNK